MSRPTDPARRPMHRLTPVLGLLLLVAVFVGGTHHHDDGRAHVCAVCTVGHAPAIAADVPASATAPQRPGGTCVAPTPGGPRAARITIESCRAPPRA